MSNEYNEENAFFRKAYQNMLTAAAHREEIIRVLKPELNDTTVELNNLKSKWNKVILEVEKMKFISCVDSEGHPEADCSYDLGKYDAFEEVLSLLKQE